MYQTGYHATGYHETGYYIPGSADIILPPGGGGGSVSAPGTRFNQAPSVDKNEPLYLTQALQEDEELLIIIKSFVETIRWH
jgi:hypothetical protein